MIKILFNRRDFISVSAIGIVCGILIACIHNALSDANSFLEDAFLYARDGYIHLSDRVYNSDTFNCLFNVLLFIPFISRIFFSDYETAKSFVFVRLDSILKWYNHKIFQSMIYSIYISLIYNLTLLIVMTIMGYNPNNIWIVIKYLILGTLAGFLILFMIVNANQILSLIIKPHLSTAVFMGLTIASMVITHYLNNEQIQFSILTNYFISWHMVMNANSVFYYYPTRVYYGSILFILVAEYFIGKQIIKKQDFI